VFNKSLTSLITSQFLGLLYEVRYNGKSCLETGGPR